MLSFLLALLCFLITIPLKAILMGIKLKDKVQDGKNKSIYEKITPQAINKIKDKTTKKDKKDAKSTEEKVKDTTKKTIKETIKAGLRAVIIFLRSLSLLLSTCGLFSILIMFVLLVVVIASVGSIIILLEGDGGGFSNDWSDGSTKKQIASETTENMNDAVAWKEKQVFTDNSSWVNCCATMHSWYVANIHTYQAGPKVLGNDGQYHSTRAIYKCSLVPETAGVGDDCSAYANAAFYYAGFYPKGSIPWWNSQSWQDGTPEIEKYFNKYTYEDLVSGVYVPRAGDIVAINGQRPDNNKYRHHVEIIAVVDNPVSKYDWGDVRTASPSKTSQNINDYLRGYKTYWSLKDGVVPPSYLEGKTVVYDDETEEGGGSHER